MASRTQSRSRSRSSQAPREDRAVAVIDPKKAAADLQRSLEGRRGQMLDLLGGDERLADRFITIALSSIVKPGSGLLEADPLSILNAVRDAAMMGLEPAGPLGEGAIVAYRDSGQGGKKIAQFQPMVRGLRKLALAHPDVTVVNVGIRHAKDIFEYREGSDPFIRHEPYIDDDDPGDVMGAYAYAKLRGETLVLYMNLAQIRKRQAVARTDKVWQAWPEEMMKKTVLRRLISEKLPMTMKLAQALAVEEADLDRATVTTPAQPQLAAPGSRTRARHAAADDVEGSGADDKPETDNQAADGAAGADGASTAATDDADASDDDATEVCNKPGPTHEGQFCVGKPKHDGPHYGPKAGAGSEIETWL